MMNKTNFCFYKKFCFLYENGYIWVKSFRDMAFAFDEDKNLRCINFLLDICCCGIYIYTNIHVLSG